MISSLGLNVVTTCLVIVEASGFLTAQAFPPFGLHLHRRQPHTTDRWTGWTHKVLLEDTTDAGSAILTALEFYSGIGGLRVSLQVAGAAHAEDRAVVIGSYEINSVANLAYEHNFPGSIVTRRSIEHLSEEHVDGVADVWLLSPPCQPFCRVGKQMDTDDPRSLSFMHLLALLERITDPPSRLFLENVRGFEGSKAHERLLTVLSTRGYDVEQYLLSPVQLGVPNTRLRYYCLASRLRVDAKGEVAPVRDCLPSDSLRQDKRNVATIRPLSEYLDPTLEGLAAVPLLLSPKAAGHANPSLRFDIVTQRSTETTTFTKGYGKHAGRAGPVLLLTEDGTRRVSKENLGRFPTGVDLGPMGRELRWCSDREMLRLHGFPEWFNFPTDITLRQRFGLVGNSVSVDVVAILLRMLLFQEDVAFDGNGVHDEFADADIAVSA